MENSGFVKADILEPSYKQDLHVFICHQVNCRGVMGAGLAKQIATRYPAVFREYREFCQANCFDANVFLGKALVSNATGEPNVSIVNLFGQDGYGRGKRYTSYTAIQLALEELARYCGGVSEPYVVRIPFLMGCGLGGGDWQAVSRIIRNTLMARNIAVEIWGL